MFITIAICGCIIVFLGGVQAYCLASEYKERSGRPAFITMAIGAGITLATIVAALVAPTPRIVYRNIDGGEDIDGRLHGVLAVYCNVNGLKPLDRQRNLKAATTAIRKALFSQPAEPAAVDGQD